MKQRVRSLLTSLAGSLTLIACIDQAICPEICQAKGKAKQSAGPAPKVFKIRISKEIVMADFEGTGDDAVFLRVRRDFDAKAVAQSDHQIRRTMDELTAKAIADVKAGR